MPQYHMTAGHYSSYIINYTRNRDHVKGSEIERFLKENLEGSYENNDENKFAFISGRKPTGKQFRLNYYFTTDIKTASRNDRCLHIKPKMHDVTIVKNIILPF